MKANDMFDVLSSLGLENKQEVCFTVPFHKKYIIRARPGIQFLQLCRRNVNTVWKTHCSFFKYSTSWHFKKK